MSIDAAISRIDQILTLQQQLTNPAALMASGGAAVSSAGTAATGTSAGTTGTASTNFASALATAQGLTGTTATGTTSATGASGAAGGTAVDSSDPRIQSMVNEANSLVGKPYVYGGGHSGWGPQTGYDCSGFVSAVLHAGGYLSSPADTVTLPSQAGMEQGPGQYVTVYDRTGSGENGHVIMSINGQFYESGGEAGPWGGGGGVEKIGTPSAAYLATFDDVLHPAGL
jgi:cell wall-associated NlpC family hydrolase